MRNGFKCELVFLNFRRPSTEAEPRPDTERIEPEGERRRVLRVRRRRQARPQGDRVESQCEYGIK